MKITEYVNSKDIRIYWEKIGYEPSVLESSWLIWQGKNQTLDEKHSSWLELLDASADCLLPAGDFEIPQDSLHIFLRRYIEIEKELINAFYKNDNNAVFSCRMYFEDDGNCEWYDEPALFYTFEAAYEHAKGDGESPQPNFIEFIKTYIGCEGKRIFVRFNAAKEIVKVDECDYLACKEDYEIFQEVFRNMSFAFPIPFKSGDVVSTVHGLYTRPLCSDGIYVVDKVLTKNGCTVVTGHDVDGNGEICNRNDYDYMNLEYAKSHLVNEDKMLIIEK